MPSFSKFHSWMQCLSTCDGLFWVGNAINCINCPFGFTCSKHLVLINLHLSLGETIRPNHFSTRSKSWTTLGKTHLFSTMLFNCHNSVLVERALEILGELSFEATKPLKGFFFGVIHSKFIERLTEHSNPWRGLTACMSAWPNEIYRMVYLKPKIQACLDSIYTCLTMYSLGPAGWRLVWADK